MAGPAHGHLGDVHPVGAEDRADFADDARHVAVCENHENAVEVGVETEIAELDQAGHVVAENRAGRQTLGGAVYDCKIAGVPVRDTGDIDGDGLAVVSVKLVLP